jgi:hypothetical protein
VQGLASGAAVAFLLALHGQVPGLISSTTEWFFLVGLDECGSLSLRNLAHGQCGLVGGPGGGSIANGIAFVAIGSVLIRVLGLTAAWAYTGTAISLMIVAFAGANLLARRVGLGRVLSFLVATLYLAGPSLVGMVGFNSTFWGVALLPAAIFVQLRLADRIATGRVASRLLALLGWWFSVAFMLALDGYAFLMAQFSVGVILAFLVIAAIRSRQAWIKVGGFMLVNVAAFLVYRLAVPGAGSWEKSSIDLFRAMGADLTTLALPSDAVWWSVFTGVGVRPELLWGDGTNARYNYLGWGVVVLAAVGFLVWRKREKLVVPLALVALLAIGLSLGPSLKVHEVRGPLTIPVTYESYLMPAKSAVLELPTTWVYEHVPGFDATRATYRWLAVSRVALLLLAGLGAQYLLALDTRGVRRLATVGLCVLAVIEIAPQAPVIIKTNATRAEMVRAFDRDVLTEMRHAIPRDSRVVFAPNAESENDYLANYLAPMLRVHAYNVGGDKALAAARPLWPEPVTKLLIADADFADAADRVLAGGYADTVVIPFFDLRWSASAWPTPDQFRKPGLAAAEQAAADPRLAVRRFDTFAIVSLAH